MMTAAPKAKPKGAAKALRGGCRDRWNPLTPLWRCAAANIPHIVPSISQKVAASGRFVDSRSFRRPYPGKAEKR